MCRTVKLANVSTGAHVPCLLARTLDENCKCQWANAHAGYRRFWLLLWKTTDCSAMRDTEAYRRKKGQLFECICNATRRKNVYNLSRRSATTHRYGVVACKFFVGMHSKHGVRMTCHTQLRFPFSFYFHFCSALSVRSLPLPFRQNALRSRTECIVRTTNHMTNETFMIMYQLPATFRRTEVHGESATTTTTGEKKPGKK